MTELILGNSMTDVGHNLLMYTVSCLTCVTMGSSGYAVEELDFNSYFGLYTFIGAWANAYSKYGCISFVAHV